ncbi:MAG: iron-sulfur cluster repair di-iron protein [Acidimicrobiales bacterium]
MTETAAGLDPTRTLGELVIEQPGRSRVFEDFGIDYCCHGQRSLADACREAGIDEGAVLGQLDAVTETEVSDIDAFATAELAEHIVETHHAYLHSELVPLQALADKVHSVHGGRHPELADVARLVAEARLELEPHLEREEQVVFPAIEALDTGEVVAPGIAEQIHRLLREHRSLGELLLNLRSVSGDYAVPADACASYTMLYGRLEHLERDTFRHIHLENNVLFPAAGVTETAPA